jgi:hypothetical protein
MTDPTVNSSPESRKRPVNSQAAYKPITREDLQQQEKGFFKDLDTPLAKRSAAILFAGIFFLGRQMYLMAPLQVVLLLACVLYRLSPRERMIAAIPVTFAAIRLGTQLGEEFTLSRVSSYPTMLQVQATGVTWVPLFLSACLFYTPWKLSRTSRAIFWQALVYLLAGLLPLEGIFVISTMLTYAMFFVTAFTLMWDLSADWVSDNLPEARPLDALPVRS